MEWKKPAVIIIGIVFMLSTIPGGGYVSAASSGIAVLVTDNEADLAIAYGVADLLNASVIISPWGTYDPAVSAEILSAEPERVIIIGGPVAVPDDYTSDLEDFGIPYERWYGDTRYETNLAVIGNLSAEFPGAFSRVQAVVVANGRDGLALKEYIESLKENRVGAYERTLLIITDSNRIAETLKALERFNELAGIVYMGTFTGGSPMFPLNQDWLSDFVRGRFGKGVSVDQIPAKPGPTDTEELLKRVQNKTKRAEEILDDLQIPLAQKKLESAKTLLNQAWEKYRAGDYSEAYRLAMMASWNDDFVIARAYREVMTIYQGSAKKRLERRILQFEVMVNVFKEKGYDVSDVESLLKQARDALDRGDYTSVLEALRQVKLMLAEKTTKRHGQGRISPPGHPGGGGGRKP